MIQKKKKKLIVRKTESGKVITAVQKCNNNDNNLNPLYGEHNLFEKIKKGARYEAKH